MRRPTLVQFSNPATEALVDPLMTRQRPTLVQFSKPATVLQGWVELYRPPLQPFALPWGIALIGCRLFLVLPDGGVPLALLWITGVAEVQVTRRGFQMLLGAKQTGVRAMLDAQVTLGQAPAWLATKFNP